MEETMRYEEAIKQLPTELQEPIRQLFESFRQELIKSLSGQPSELDQLPELIRELSNKQAGEAQPATEPSET